MRLFWAIAGEVARAVSVLALVFLSFGHQPLAIERSGGTTAVSTAIICGVGFAGDPSDPRSRTKNTCELCRVATSIDLPTPPLFACPVLVPLGKSDTGFFFTAAFTTPDSVGGGPRAPPVLAAA